MKTICFNLGACIGKKTMHFAKRFDLVVSVEPIIENYEILVETIVKNKLENVIPIFAAISDESCLDKIYLDDSREGHSVYRKKRFTDATPTRSILAIAWDDLIDCLNIDHVDYAKVDIEGAEEDLLGGMTKVFPKRMLIETHGRHGVTDVENLFRLLKKGGYVLEREYVRKYIRVKHK